MDRYSTSTLLSSIGPPHATVISQFRGANPDKPLHFEQVRCSPVPEEFENTIKVIEFFLLLALHPFPSLLLLSLLPVTREGGRGRERQDGMEKQDRIEREYFQVSYLLS